MKLRSQIYKFLDPIYRKYFPNLTMDLFKLLKKGPSRLIETSCLSSEDVEVSLLPEVYKIEQPFVTPFYLPGVEQENRLKFYQEFYQFASSTEHQLGTVSLKNVFIEFPSSLHMWQGKVVKDVTTHIRATLLSNLEDLYYMLTLESILWRKKIRIEKECILILGSFPENYWHWLVQILPKIAIIEKNPNLKDLPILLPNKLPGFVRESLEITGYLDKVIFLDDGVYQIEKLHICTHLWKINPDLTYPQTIQWLRQNLTKQENFNQKRRIYVSRKDARYRFITNESELEPILNKYGFEIITLSDFDLEQKIQIFREAEIIVGNFGAGLSNLVFATPGSIIIEIFPENATKETYYMLAVLLNLKYGFLLGNIDGAGIYVEPQKFAEIIEKGLSQL